MAAAYVRERLPAVEEMGARAGEEPAPAVRRIGGVILRLVTQRPVEGHPDAADRIHQAQERLEVHFHEVLQGDVEVFLDRVDQAGRAPRRGAITVVGAVDLGNDAGTRDIARASDLRRQVPRDRHHRCGAVVAQPDHHDHVREPVVVGVAGAKRVVGSESQGAVGTDDEIILPGGAARQHRCALGCVRGAWRVQGDIGGCDGRGAVTRRVRFAAAGARRTVRICGHGGRLVEQNVRCGHRLLGRRRQNAGQLVSLDPSQLHQHVGRHAGGRCPDEGQHRERDKNEASPPAALAHSAASERASLNDGYTNRLSAMSWTRRFALTARATTEISSAACLPTMEPPST